MNCPWLLLLTLAGCSHAARVEDDIAFVASTSASIRFIDRAGAEVSGSYSTDPVAIRVSGARHRDESTCFEKAGHLNPMPGLPTTWSDALGGSAAGTAKASREHHAAV